MIVLTTFKNHMKRAQKSFSKLINATHLQCKSPDNDYPIREKQKKGIFLYGFVEILRRRRIVKMHRGHGHVQLEISC